MRNGVKIAEVASLLAIKEYKKKNCNITQFSMYTDSPVLNGTLKYLCKHISNISRGT